MGHSFYTDIPASFDSLEFWPLPLSLVPRDVWFHRHFDLWLREVIYFEILQEKSVLGPPQRRFLQIVRLYFVFLYPIDFNQICNKKHHLYQYHSHFLHQCRCTRRIFSPFGLILIFEQVVGHRISLQFVC